MVAQLLACRLWTIPHDPEGGGMQLCLFLLSLSIAPVWSYSGSPIVQGHRGWLSAGSFGERGRCSCDRLRGGGVRGGAAGMSMFDRSGNANRKQKNIIWISALTPCIIKHFFGRLEWRGDACPLADEAKGATSSTSPQVQHGNLGL